MRQGLAVLLLGLTALLAGPIAAGQADSTTQLPFTSGPLWLAVDPAGQHVFVSGGPGTSSIVVLDFNGTIVKTITGEQGASEMAVDTTTPTLYAALHDANAISEIDTTTLTETTRFSTTPFASPTSLVIAGASPAGTKLWFSCSENGGGCVAAANLDGTGMASEDLLGIGSSAEATALATGGAHMLALAVRGSSPAAVATYDVAQDPAYLTGNSSDGGCPDGGGDLQDLTVQFGSNLLVACSTPDYVATLSGAYLGSSAEYPIGAYPDSVAASGAYVAAGRQTNGGPDIAVYRASDQTLVRTWSLETQDDLPAHALAFSPDPSKLFAVVANSDTGHMDFHVLDGATVETTTTLTPPQQTILAGDKATLTAQVTGVSAGTVDLYGTPSGGSRTLVATGTLGSGSCAPCMGTVSFTVSPATATTYSAVLEAGPDYPSSTSQDVTVTVVPRSMPFAASQHAVAYGGKAKLTLTGVATSGKVDLFATPNGQSRVLLNTATVPEGQHTVTFTVAPERTTAYVAEREDRSAASNNVAVSVHPLLVFAVHAKRVSPQMVRRHGEKVVLGAVRSPPLPGEPLKIEIDKARAHGGWKMVARGEIPVGATGVVIGVLTVKLTGKYRAQMSFAGDGDYTSVRSAWRRFRVG